MYISMFRNIRKQRNIKYALYGYNLNFKMLCFNGVPYFLEIPIKKLHNWYCGSFIVNI